MPLPRQIVLLIPRLASEHDGEVVATVRAIGRLLKSAGLDWHTLSEALSAPPRETHQQRRNESPPQRSELHEQQIRVLNDIITWLNSGSYRPSSRESDFLESLREQLLLRPATAKQEAWLCDLHRKVGRAYSRRK